jgi:hypothetical protein
MCNALPICPFSKETGSLAMCTVLNLHVLIKGLEGWSLPQGGL